MTKKNLLLIVSVGVALLIGLGVALCSRSQSDDCSVALPEDATLVGRINAKEWVEQNGLSLADLKDFVLSPDESGVDYGRTAYVFAFQSYFGAVVPLTDKDDFFEKTSLYHSEVEEQRGLSWATFNESFLCVADGNKAMLIGPATKSEQDALRNTLYSCMTEGGGGQSNELFKQLTVRTEPVAIAASLDAVPAQYLNWLTNVLPEDVGVTDFTLCAGLSTHKNQLTLSAHLLAEGKKASSFLSEVDGVMKPIDASLCSQSPSNPFLRLEMGLCGSKLIELLRKNPDMRTKMLGANMIFDLDMILKSIDGEVQLTMPKFSPFKQPLLLQANLTDDAFMKNVSSWNEGASESAGVKFLPARNDCYLCAYNGQVCYFGVREKRLFAANEEQYTIPQDNTAHQPADEEKGNKVYAVLDMTSLTDMLDFLPDGLKDMQRMTLSSKTASEWTLTLTASEGTDLLESIIK